jgi:NTP pyrophosphatase (non-canonical NTP hydrolase)
MKMKKFQKLARVTAKDGQSDRDRKANMAMGLAGEAGETADLIKKNLYHEHPIDLDKLKKELGDTLWYVAMVADSYGICLDDVAESNIAKLKARYGDKFTVAKSIHRNG